MKSKSRERSNITYHVAPFAGAWIEIAYTKPQCNLLKVAPFAGAWIEIIFRDLIQNQHRVAPFAGAWIEMLYLKSPEGIEASRSLRGSVD